MPKLIDVVLESREETVAEEAIRAIIAITRRGGYEQYVGQLILERLEKLDVVTDRCRLISALAAAPGVDSLKYLQDASKNRNTRVRDCAVRMLADYPEPTAAPILLDIYKTTQNKAHRILALRGCSRLCKTTDIPAENTVKLCKKIGFEKAYIALYSPRPGTAAFKMEDNISYSEKKRRWKILDSLINRSG